MRYKRDQTVTRYETHAVITQPNPLRHAVRRTQTEDIENVLARAEKALESLSHNFRGWMEADCASLSEAHQQASSAGFAGAAMDSVWRAAQAIKNNAATYRFAAAGDVAGSLCHLLSAGSHSLPPPALVARHVDAIKAMVREDTLSAAVTDEVVERLRLATSRHLDSAMPRVPSPPLAAAG